MFKPTKSALNFKAIHKLSLHFKDKTIEASYQNTTEPIRKLQMRLALLFVGILYAIVSVLDPYTMPEQHSFLTMSIHLSQACVFTCLALLSIRFKSLFFHYTMIIGSVCIAWANHLFLVNTTSSALLFNEAYLMVIWIWLITGLSFNQATKLCGFFIITYEANAILLSNITLAEMITQQFYFYVSCIFGSLAGYLIEYHKRQNFLTLQQVSTQAAELRLANAQLAQDKASLTKLSQAVEQSDESILIADKEGVTEYINPAFTSTTGYQANDIIGNVSNILQPKQQPDMWKKLQQGKTWSSTINASKKDGSSYPALVSVAPIKDNNGEIIHYVTTERDMTEYKDLENQLLQAQKMEAIGTLVGGIAHDFNNTLTGITSTVFLAKNEISHLPKTLKRLDLIESLSFQASDMIKQLLAFSRKGIVSLKPMSLTTFLQDISKLHKITLPSKILFTQDFLPSHNLIVCADANQLQQVIINLLNNAKDAVLDTQNPTVSLHLDTWTADPKFKALHPEIKTESFARISISDNGHGIPKDKQDSIFEPFYTTKGVNQGTGLGLSMAYGTAKSHGGLITVTSQQGEGATFELLLPLKEDEIMNTSIPTKKEISLGNHECILLVDDEEPILATGSDILKSLDYQVIQASNGREALYLYKTHQDKIKLVILDIAMPKMDGIEAAKQLRIINPDINIIFITGFDFSQQLNAQGVSSEKVILKPFKISTFSQVIQSELSLPTSHT